MTDKVAEKKVVSRNVTIAVGIVCIILVVSLVGVIVSYTLVMNGKDNTIANLTDTVNLEKYVYWVTNQTVSQPAGNHTSWTFSANVSGFIVIDLRPTTNNTFIRVNYTAILPLRPPKGGLFYHYDYDKQIAAYPFEAHYIFPVLSSTVSLLSPTALTTVEIRVGNTNSVDGSTEIVTIEYHY